MDEFPAVQKRIVNRLMLKSCGRKGENITIKEHLRREARRAYAAFSLVIIFITILAFSARALGIVGNWVEPMLLLLFAVLLILFWKLQCPGCHRTLSMFAASLDMCPGSSSQFNFCPKCGMSFNNPYHP